MSEKETDVIASLYHFFACLGKISGLSLSSSLKCFSQLTWYIVEHIQSIKIIMTHLQEIYFMVSELYVDYFSSYGAKHTLAL